MFFLSHCFWELLITSPVFFCFPFVFFVLSSCTGFWKFSPWCNYIFSQLLVQDLVFLRDGWSFCIGHCLMLSVLKKIATSASKIVRSFPRCFATLWVSSYPEVQRFELSDRVVIPSANSSLMCLISLCPKLEMTFENRLLFVITSSFKWLKDIWKLCLQDLIISEKPASVVSSFPWLSKPLRIWSLTHWLILPVLKNELLCLSFRAIFGWSLSLETALQNVLAALE